VKANFMDIITDQSTQSIVGAESSLAPGSQPSVVKTRKPTILFRIIGHHHHAAVRGETTFSCVHSTRAPTPPFAMRWSAFKDDILLHGECPTLNDAKRYCREAAGEIVPAPSPSS
jgi:hypothetical protein